MSGVLRNPFHTLQKSVVNSTTHFCEKNRNIRSFETALKAKLIESPQKLADNIRQSTPGRLFSNNRQGRTVDVTGLLRQVQQSYSHSQVMPTN